MKHISRIFVIAGAALLFLICILIGMVQYKNVRAREEEKTLSMENSLKEYLAERVNEIEPQYITENSNQMSDVQKQETQKLIEERVELLIKELKEQFSQQLDEETLLFIKENLYQDMTSYVENYVAQYAQSLREEYEKIVADKSEELKQEIEQLLLAYKTENGNLQKTVMEMYQQIADLKKQIQQYESMQGNIKMERWDAETQSLYLVPVE